ncbi:Transcriptional regulatory protein DegU [bioreactor metagenome]|uniref:Transcriptional regulatory protein DegU n=1 Tax=bioreactor metagenome TaxID=1076179 RepID=A0A645GPS9_9ZZZZ
MHSSIIALALAFIILIILPILHNKLSDLLKIKAYSVSVTAKDHKETLYISQLTERENEIVALLLKGRTYKMIADEMYLSENTIKTHIKNIYSKLNVNSKTELIKLINGPLTLKR